MRRKESTAGFDTVCATCSEPIEKGAEIQLQDGVAFCCITCARLHAAENPYTFYRDYGEKIGSLVAEKQRQYGDAVGKTGKILAVLYPDGVRPERFTDFLMTVRVLDKLSRISQRGADGKDLGGESPWKDIAGYGLLGWRKDEEGSTS